MKERLPVLTGGCQCGAIRFASYTKPGRISVCHCRMCQKAVAGPFASLVEIPQGDFAWTRGMPATFRSSSAAERDFCATCGTPLSYRKLNGSVIELLTGAFDRPDRVVPTYQTGIESKLAWIIHLHNLPGKTTAENDGPQVAGSIVSYQHPDHNT
ncbi:MAG: GFA family protein [Afipia sp.]|nr:GFA family protein [Afipia sp.]